ncbi:protein artichoke-like [Lytechinus variegatus]|uniref:protein artichoke-like n=1 Tax=Lytechinus variegatus TaxID=7654 RepID=UPI001BB101CB|nr:protein artichoke-like [Lytechinus variegatus]
MEILRTLSVCLVFLLPLLSSVKNESCQLHVPSSAIPLGCVCSGLTLVCTGFWPTKAQLQTMDVLESLTITNTTRNTLLKCESMFGTLPKLKRLDLSSNQINFTKPRSFSSYCFPNLEQLILDNNALRLNAHTTFKSLDRLRGLHLNNALYKNQSVSEQLTHTFIRSAMPSLEEIMLNDNMLGDLSPSTFNFNVSGSSPISRIHLRNSRLGVIQPQLFEVETLPNLSFIDLSMNRITGLPEENLESFNKFSSALTINLTGNPLTCNCQLEDFVIWLKSNSTKVINPETLNCSEESIIHSGKRIIDLDPKDLTCTHIRNTDMDEQMKTSYILLIAVLSIIGILAIVILFMRRKEIIKFCNQMKQATKETFDTHHTSYVYSDITRATRETPEHSAVDV